MRPMAVALIKGIVIWHGFIRPVEVISNEVIPECYLMTGPEASAEIGVSVINPGINNTDSDAFPEIALCVDFVNPLQEKIGNVSFWRDTEIKETYSHLKRRLAIKGNLLGVRMPSGIV